MRYRAPARAAVPAATFAHPVFDGLTDAQRALCRQPHWPGISELNALWQAPASGAGARLRFVAQEPLDDGLHYERRIHDHGLIATRSDNWHDLFNAFVWMRFPALKTALNRRQVEDLARVGTSRRTRAQSAMTHFDEAGAVIRLDDKGLLAAWDGHDWPTLFRGWQAAERRGALQCWLFGHALMEHALTPSIALVAKALVIAHPAPMDDAQVDALLATRVRDGVCLNDPQELRPIPLTGAPGWHPGQDRPDFFEFLPCFQPKREGRSYPPPIRL